MNPNIESILDGVSTGDIALVVRNALGNPAASVIGKPTWREIDAVHNDQRTLAIVRCSGAADSGGKTVTWSCVVKIIDSSQEANVAASWNDPAMEEKVYELGLMTDLGVPFRPAKCFGVNPLRNDVKLIWLEDLGSAPQPPWTMDEYLQVALHVGEFNGRMIVDPPKLPFNLPVDGHRARRNAIGSTFSERFASIRENSSHPVLQAALQDVSIKSVVELNSLFGELHEVSPGLPHGLVFGDCHARNLFPLEHETVAVDWAGLASDPVGTDLSVLVGSAFSWSVDEAVMVAQNEPAIFEMYKNGLRNAGWDGEWDDVRRAFFTHLPIYLMFSIGLVELIRSGKANGRKEWFEARRGASFQEIPERMAPIIALIPGYVEELRQLLH